MSAPCKDCKFRCPACHDRCLTYKDWIATVHEKKEEIKKHSLSESDYFHINNIYKAKRRNNL